MKEPSPAGLKRASTWSLESQASHIRYTTHVGFNFHPSAILPFNDLDFGPGQPLRSCRIRPRLFNKVEVVVNAIVCASAASSSSRYA